MKIMAYLILNEPVINWILSTDTWLNYFLQKYKNDNIIHKNNFDKTLNIMKTIPMHISEKVKRIKTNIIFHMLIKCNDNNTKLIPL